MDTSIHKVTGLRIVKPENSVLNTIDLVIEYEALCDTRPFYTRGGETEVFGYAKLETTITLFISDAVETDTVLWQAIAEITSRLTNA